MKKVEYCEINEMLIDYDDCLSCVKWDDCPRRIEEASTSRLMAWLLIAAISIILAVLAVLAGYGVFCMLLDYMSGRI